MVNIFFMIAALLDLQCGCVLQGLYPCGILPKNVRLTRIYPTIAIIAHHMLFFNSIKQFYAIFINKKIKW